MKYPTHIRITGKVRYQIAWVDQFADKYDIDTTGICCEESKTIFIKKGMRTMATLEAIVHEYYHALAYEYNIDIPHWLIYKLEKPTARTWKLNGWVKRK